MKKFTLFAACAAFALGMNAQTVMFTQKGTEIPNGETVTCTDWADDGWGTFTCDPELSILSTQNILINLTAECQTEDRQVALCCAGGCTMGTTVVKNNISLTANELFPIEFHTTYFDDEPETPTIITDIYVTDAGSDTKLASITVITKGGGNAVSVFEADNTLVRYENGELVYSAETPCDLVLYSTNGQCVLEQKVSGNGSIKAAELGAGVYVYTIGNKSGKVVIR